jgi:hypothetical protein
MYEANEMPVEQEETIAVKSFQYSKTIRGLVVERQGAGGNKTVQIVNLGRHGLFQADLARSEYIMAGASGQDNEGRALPRAAGRLVSPRSRVGGRADDSAAGSSAATTGCAEDRAPRGGR